MLRILDSWYAVASAMLAARAGMPRCTAIAAISAAFSDCSGSRSTVRPDTVAVQPLGSGSGPKPSLTATAVAATTARAARPTTTRPGRATL